jgi:hypothetical protein
MATQERTRLETEDAMRDRATEEGPLWVELEISALGTDRCPVTQFGREASEGRVQLVGDHCTATLDFEGPTQRDPDVVTGTVTDACTCARVCEPGISPAEILVADGALEITAVVDSRERLTELADGLRESGDEWHLRRLTAEAPPNRAEAEPGTDLPEEISLTDKQREVVEEAVTRGYYRNPREASLAELAAELEVTRSALSQRLNAVEAKLIQTLAREL